MTFGLLIKYFFLLFCFCFFLRGNIFWVFFLLFPTAENEWLVDLEVLCRFVPYCWSQLLLPFSLFLFLFYLHIYKSLLNFLYVCVCLFISLSICICVYLTSLINLYFHSLVHCFDSALSLSSSISLYFCFHLTIFVYLRFLSTFFNFNYPYQKSSLLLFSTVLSLSNLSQSSNLFS